MNESGVFLMDEDEFLCFIDAMVEYYNDEGDDSVE